MIEDYSERCSEYNRGYWFSQRNQRFLYSYDKNNRAFYLIDEQEQNITKIDNEECIKLLRNTYALQLEQGLIDWLINEEKSGLKYFKNIDELEKYYDEM